MRITPVMVAAFLAAGCSLALAQAGGGAAGGGAAGGASGGAAAGGAAADGGGGGAGGAAGPGAARRGQEGERLVVRAPGAAANRGAAWVATSVPRGASADSGAV